MKDASAMTGLEQYRDAKGELLAMILRRSFRGGKYNFFTPDDFPLQMGTSFYAAGELIQPHVHLAHVRTIESVNEFLLVQSGRLELTLYTKDRDPVTTVELQAGDALLLTSGGHGFRVLEPTQLIEVKQGPYLGMDDKVKW
jgi:hypothetical protein